MLGATSTCSPSALQAQCKAPCRRTDRMARTRGPRGPRLGHKVIANGYHLCRSQAQRFAVLHAPPSARVRPTRSRQSPRLAHAASAWGTQHHGGPTHLLQNLALAPPPIHVMPAQVCADGQACAGDQCNRNLVLLGPAARRHCCDQPVSMDGDSTPLRPVWCTPCTPCTDLSKISIVAFKLLQPWPETCWAMRHGLKSDFLSSTPPRFLYWSKLMMLYR